MVNSLKTNKLRILNVADVFYPDILSGAGRYLYDLSRFLVRRGHNVTVLTRMRGTLPEHDLIDGIKIVRFKWVNPIFSYFDEQKKIKDILKNEKIDIVFFHQPLSAIFALNFFKKIPKIYFFYSPWHKEFELKRMESKIITKFSPIYRMLEGWILNRSDIIITLSDFTKKLIVDFHHLEENRVKIVPGGVDLSIFNLNIKKEDARERLKLPKSKFIILTIRNLVQRMGLENLIIATKLLKLNISDFLVVIGGEGPLFHKLLGMRDENGLQDKILFTDRISDEDIPYYYRAADLFVLPTRQLEGFGLITLEAMASGRVVLGTPVGATVEILSAINNNFLMASTDPESISNKILEFVDDKGNHERILYEFVEQKYSWEVISCEVEKIAMGLSETRKNANLSSKKCDQVKAVLSKITMK